MIPNLHLMWYAVPSNNDEFEKWQKEIREAEAEAEAEADANFGGALVEGDDRPSTPPEGEEEFTDDDGTTYKWDRGLRAWVPQVGALKLIFFFFVLLLFDILIKSEK